MKFQKTIFTIILFLITLFNFSQEREIKKITISGKVIEKKSNQPLEFAIIAFMNTKNAKAIFGGITDSKGEFAIEINSGLYDVKVEFIGFKSLDIKQQKYFNSSNLGALIIEENNNELQEVVVRSEKSSVDIKLDKKVFNVGKDMIVKGGNASDVLQNVPSITVDSEGIVSLRGNENVKILIDGRPINSSNLANALKSIPADALDKVEVISNPSARYEAEGGSGIVNIVLKKGKSNGLNGTATATVGNPKNNNLNGTLNYKSEKYNLFAGFGYTDSKTPGFNLTNTDYYDTNRNISKSINEDVTLERLRNGINFNFGFDWFLTKKLTWTNNLSNRKSDSKINQNSNLYNTDALNSYYQNRFNDQKTSENNVEYTTNFTQKFKKEGEKLTLDGSFSRNFDNDNTTIYDNIYGAINVSSIQKSKNLQTQYRNLLQSDFVLPIGKNSQFETGYRGNFTNLVVDYAVGNIDNTGIYTAIPNYTNVFQYKEKINAFYTQFGSKINKVSYLFGLRYENTDLNINLLTTNNYTTKKYDNLFPSAFLSYQLTEKTSISINYSKRIARPRDRFMIPFSNYSSNVILFQGNPDINPAFTDVFELSYLSKWDKLTLTAAVFYNKTKDLFQFTRRNNGDIVTTVVGGADILDANGNVILIVGGADIRTPVLISTPVNLDKEERFGIELNANFAPLKWWKLNANVNVFSSQISGNFSYVLNNSNTVISQYIDRAAGSWFAKLNSNITLPYKINFQSNAVYTAAQNTAQGQALATLVANLAFSKDVLNDKATISLSVSDLFNQQKLIRQFETPVFASYSERQGRVRQVNLSFTYRFNKQKSEREKQPKREEMGGGDF
jgi:outer membrane receptor protein involved in Fe transport